MRHIVAPARRIVAGSRRNFARHFLLASVAAVACFLGACESPLAPDYAYRGNAGTDLRGASYSDTLVARAIMNGSYTSQFVQTGTLIGGSQDQWPRVDSPGPSTGAAIAPIDAPTGSTTVPEWPTTQRATTQPDDTFVEGLDAAQLHMKEPAFELSLQDAISRAVRNSLAIKIEGFNPAIKETLIIQAEAAFDAVAFAQSQWQNLNEPQISPGFTNGQTWQNEFGIHKLLPSGAVAQISGGVTYRDITIPAGQTLSMPNSYTTDINLQITQPLLRGFGADVNEANIYLAQRDQRISLETFRRQVITTVADTEEAYLNLVAARTNLDILERLVKASAQTYNIILRRSNLDADKAAVNQALSALESRRADLLRAQKDFRQLSDRLKNLLNDPELNINENSVITPTDKPLVEPMLYDVADCIETALRQRTEVQEARLQVERADIVVRVAKNGLLPKLDLVVGMQTNGLDNSFDQAFNASVGTNSLDWNAGVKLEFPLGNREAEATYRQRLLERQSSLTHIVLVAQQVVTDVKNQLRELMSSYVEIRVRQRARIAAGLELEGIIQIQDIRALTPEFLQLKLDAQANLATAEQNLTQAIVNYNLAIMRVEESKGTLLEFNRISLDRPPTGWNHDNSGKWRFLGKTTVTK